MKNYSVFVINISDKRWEKYSQDTQNIYNRFMGVDGSKLDLDDYKHYCFYWNKSEKARRGALEQTHRSFRFFVWILCQGMHGRVELSR